MPHSHPGGLDALIDDVAREMSGPPPTSGFAARVAARIANADRLPSRRGWSRAWLLSPLAVAAVVLLAVFVTREARKSELRRPAPTLVNSPLPDVAAQEKHRQSPADIRQPIATGTRAAAEPAGRRTPAPVMSPTALPAEAAVAPLAFAPIDGIERIDVQPIARGEQIDISPIAINRIDIAAMP